MKQQSLDDLKAKNSRYADVVRAIETKGVGYLNDDIREEMRVIIKQMVTSGKQDTEYAELRGRYQFALWYLDRQRAYIEGHGKLQEKLSNLKDKKS